MNIDLTDYEKWVDANKPKHFSLYDYIHGVLKSATLPVDVIYALSKLFWPDFYIQNGNIFLKEEFSTERHDELLSNGHEGSKLEYWMNLLSIDGLFENATLQQSKALGQIMSESWQAKLEQEFDDRNFDVQCIVDKDKEEVFVVFNQK